MATIASTTPVARGAVKESSTLVTGDRLTRDEFERRYRTMGRIHKAELIEGVVYMPSPVRFNLHGRPHSILIAWLVHYVAKTPGLGNFADNTTVRLDNDNEPQPDVFLLMPTQLGGKAKIDEDDYVSGAPALICEVAGSSVSIDLHLKKTAYRRNGVQEYIVWRTEDLAIDWFALEGGDFVQISAESDGTIRSRVFPGLWLNPASLINGDLSAIFTLLDQGAATAEHAEFVKRLAVAS